MAEASASPCIAGILIFHGVEEIEFAAPFAVFAAMRRLQIHSGDSDLPETHAITLARSPGIIHGANGLRLLADYDLTMCPALDVLIVPGSGEIGEPTTPAMEDVAFWDFVHERAPQVRCLASVGTGAFVLAKAGVLAGRRATTRAPYRAQLGRFDGVTPSDEGLVEDGAVWTAASGAWGMRLALGIVARLYGDPAARRVAREVEMEGGPG